MAQEIEFGEWFSERWESLSRSVKDHFKEYDVHKKDFAHHTSLVIILFLAFIVRLFPLILGWDPLVKAFDPHMQIRAATYILNHGLLKFLVWVDTQRWYPYGTTVGTALYPGVPVASATFYEIFHFLGFNVSVHFAGFIMPAFMGTLCVYYTYLLGKELVSARAGLIAGMIMVCSPAYLSRSIAGFTDNESLGVLFMVMTFYYFSRSFIRNSSKDAVLAAISQTLMAGSWGAYRFVFDLLAVFALVMVMTGNYSARFMKTYATTISISVLLMIMIPREGGKLLTDIEGIAPIGMIAFLILYGFISDLSKSMKPEVFRRILITSFGFIAIVLGSVLGILLILNSVSFVGSKFISVIFPNFRNSLPLIQSVSEHLPLAWGNLWSNLSTLVFFLPVGIYYALRKPTERNLFVVTVGVLSIYFSGSMVRLVLLLAPIAAVLTGLAIDSILTPYAYITHGRIKLTKTTMTLETIDSWNAITTYVIVFVLMFIMLSSGVTAAADQLSTPELTPPISQTDPLNNALTDWLDAFQWMSTHTSYNLWDQGNNYQGYSNSQPPVMLAWWDYGDYISTEGHTITLVDNATTNSTQIGVAGTMLMYNATAALPLMYQYHVQYVLVVPALGQAGLGSDIGKAIWMIRISQKYTPQFGVKEANYFQNNAYTNVFYQSVLYQLMAYRSPDMPTSGQQGVPPFIDDNNIKSLVPDYRNQVVTSLQYFTEVFRSKGLPTTPGVYPYVRIFRVDYPSDILLRVNQFQQNMAKIYAQNK